MVHADITALRALSASGLSFAMLHRPARDPDSVEILTGTLETLTRLHELAAFVETCDVLTLVPYRQICERGFACNDDAAALLIIAVQHRETVSRSELFDALPAGPIDLTAFQFDIPDRDYEQIVKTVIANEIGAGEGSNFVISRSLVGSFGADHLTKSLRLFRRLLANRQGVYWIFLVHTGTHTFVGATPEAHLVLEGGKATMNPISGTYRYPATGATASGLKDFLADPKEIDELFMVVDEELKMMSRICPEGGVISGPYLKQMAHLAHTEYLIRGQTSLTPAALLRETMFAPTVTGSPLENACRVIARYEPAGRGYYSGIIAMIDRAADGRFSMDSAILIRTAVIGENGKVRVTVGSTLVGDSNPKREALETHAKAAALVSASAPRQIIGESWNSAFIDALTARNEAANSFWFTPHSQRRASASTRPIKRALLIDAEDHFSAMMATMLASAGMAVEIVAATEKFVMPDYDLVVFGPGPGDPRVPRVPRIGALQHHIHEAMCNGTPFLAVCLSHQIACKMLGLPLQPLGQPSQGVSRDILLFGHLVRVGFYNTFAARCTVDAFVAETGHIRVSRNALTGEVYALRGPTFESIQFHLESVMSPDGRFVLESIIERLLSRRDSGLPT